MKGIEWRDPDPRGLAAVGGRVAVRPFAEREQAALSLRDKIVVIEMRAQCAQLTALHGRCYCCADLDEPTRYERLATEHDRIYSEIGGEGGGP